MLISVPLLLSKPPELKVLFFFSLLMYISITVLVGVRKGLLNYDLSLLFCCNWLLLLGIIFQDDRYIRLFFRSCYNYSLLSYLYNVMYGKVFSL